MESCRDGVGGYPAELRERAVRLVAESRGHHDSEWASITSVAAKLGVGTAETVRKWVRRAEIDAGARPGVTSQESADLRKLRAEVRELRRANEILKAAVGFYADPAVMPTVGRVGGGRGWSGRVACGCRTGHPRR